MIYVSRKEHFNAAHQLYNPGWSKEKNIEVFGPCANENWHGHNFDLIVTVKGNPDPETGFVVDLKKLSTTIRRDVIDKLDHKNLNVDVDFMKGKKWLVVRYLRQRYGKSLSPLSKRSVHRDLYIRLN